MFTGIISNLGKLIKNESPLFIFQTDKLFCKNVDNGTSIAVNGVCLTVVKKTENSFSVEIMPETAQKTMLENLEIQGIVNLELPVTLNTFLSGHIVQGHIDGVGKIAKITKDGNSRIIQITIPASLSKFIVEKGSIAVNGISLTIIKSGKNYFTVGIIPFTWENTMLKNVKIGDKVNIETDILAKYMDKIVNKT